MSQTCITFRARMATDKNWVVSDKYAIKLQAMENIMSQTCITFIARMTTDKIWVVKDNMPLNCRIGKHPFPDLHHLQSQNGHRQELGCKG